ncbi:MAG: hypothetical protein ACOCYZ_01835 [Halococcoides sp.]
MTTQTERRVSADANGRETTAVPTGGVARTITLCRALQGASA